LRLLDEPVDIVIGQTGCDDARPRCAPAGDQLVGLDRDRNTIVRVEAALRELGGDLADSGFDHFASRSHGSSPSLESRLPGPGGQIRVPAPHVSQLNRAAGTSPRATRGPSPRISGSAAAVRAP
jgi:hypothetical protein